MLSHPVTDCDGGADTRDQIEQLKKELAVKSVRRYLTCQGQKHHVVVPAKLVIAAHSGINSQRNSDDGQPQKYPDCCIDRGTTVPWRPDHDSQTSRNRLWLLSDKNERRCGFEGEIS